MRVSLYWMRVDIGEGRSWRKASCENRRREERNAREIRRSGRQANRYASESIFARYTTVLHSECIPRHTGVHEHTHASYSLSATLMWHDSQWLPRSASWTESGRKRVVSRPESWISPLLDHPRSANISLFAPLPSLLASRDSSVSPFSSRASSSANFLSAQRWLLKR